MKCGCRPRTRTWKSRVQSPVSLLIPPDGNKMVLTEGIAPSRRRSKRRMLSVTLREHKWRVSEVSLPIRRGPDHPFSRQCQELSWLLAQKSRYIVVTQKQ